MTPLSGSAEPDVAPWPGRWILYLVGAMLLAFGLTGILQDTNGWTHPLRWALLIAVGAVAHDLVFVPLVFALGLPLSRVTGTGIRRYLATGLGVSLCLLAVAMPGLRSTGRLPDNPTVLPLDYGRGLVLSLTAVWLGTLAAYILNAVRAELRERDADPPVHWPAGTVTGSDPRTPPSTAAGGTA